MMHWGAGGYGYSFLWLFFWLLIIIGAVLILQRLLEHERAGEDAMEILKRRYARGDISREEFEQKKRDLEASE